MSGVGGWGKGEGGVGGSMQDNVSLYVGWLPSG